MPGKPGSFKTPIRRRVKLRYIRDALRGRASLMPLRCPLAHRRGIAIPGPFGSANRAASSKPARFFRRWRRFAGFPLVLPLQKRTLVLQAEFFDKLKRHAAYGSPPKEIK